MKNLRRNQAWEDQKESIALKGKHRLAAGKDILEGSLKIPGIPRISDIAATTSIRHQQMNLSLRIIRNNTPDKTQIGRIHTNDTVETGIITPGNLTGTLRLIKRHPMLRQATLSRRINRIANLLCRHSRRLDVIKILQPPGLNKRLKYEFSHRTPANVPVTHKQDFHAANINNNCIFASMNYSGIIVGAAVFFSIGICHPAIIKMEYYWGKQSWWIWLVTGLACCGISLFVENQTVSTIIGGFAFSCLWGILEMFQQEKRVLKGWFPENPKRHAYYEALRNK